MIEKDFIEFRANLGETIYDGGCEWMSKKLERNMTRMNLGRTTFHALLLCPSATKSVSEAKV